MNTEEVGRAREDVSGDVAVGVRVAGQDISRLIEEAKKEWIRAQALFENVSDPEMVDHAIHLIMTAEKKYTYLLRLAKVETG